MSLSFQPPKQSKVYINNTVVMCEILYIWEAYTIWVTYIKYGNVQCVI